MSDSKEDETVNKASRILQAITCQVRIVRRRKSQVGSEQEERK